MFFLTHYYHVINMDRCFQLPLFTSSQTVDEYFVQHAHSPVFISDFVPFKTDEPERILKLRNTQPIAAQAGDSTFYVVRCTDRDIVLRHNSLKDFDTSFSVPLPASPSAAPFMELEIARALEDHSRIRKAYFTCFNFLQGSSPNLAASWARQSDVIERGIVSISEVDGLASGEAERRDTSLAVIRLQAPGYFLKALDSLSGSKRGRSLLIRNTLDRFLGGKSDISEIEILKKRIITIINHHNNSSIFNPPIDIIVNSINSHSKKAFSTDYLIMFEMAHDLLLRRGSSRLFTWQTDIIYYFIKDINLNKEESLTRVIFAVVTSLNPRFPAIVESFRADGIRAFQRRISDYSSNKSV